MKCGACDVECQIAREADEGHVSVDWCPSCGRITYDAASPRDRYTLTPLVASRTSDLARMMFRALLLDPPPPDLLAMIADEAAARVAGPDLYWTWEKPTVAGVYMWRDRSSVSGVLVEVVLDQQGVVRINTGNGTFERATGTLGQWSNRPVRVPVDRPPET